MSNEATAEAQQKRLAAMKGKKLVWLTCYVTLQNFEGMKSIFEKMVELGVKNHILFPDGPEYDGLLQQCQDLGYLKDAFPIRAELTTEGCIKAIEATGEKFDGIFTPHDPIQTLCGSVAAHFGTTFNSPTAIKNAADKKESRIVCEKAGIPTPKYGKITKLEEIDQVVAHVGLPLVLKPSSGGASEGVYKCHTKEDVIDKFNRLSDELTSNKILACYEGCVLVEEFMDGDEFDIDILMWDGEIMYDGCTDNWPTMEPTFLETGSNNPSLYSPRKQQQLKTYAAACLKAMGFTMGAFHVECKYSMKPERLTKAEDGEVLGQPLLIEVNPRMGGGRTRLFHQKVWNVDLLLEFILASSNIPINPPRPSKPNCAMADYDVCCEVSGTICNNTWLADVESNPHVVQAVYHVKSGEDVRGADNGVPDWAGMFLVRVDPEEGVDIASKCVDITKKLVGTVTIPIDPHMPSGPGIGNSASWASIG